MRLLQLQAVTPSQKRASDGTSEQLEKRVSLDSSKCDCLASQNHHYSFLQFKAMEDGIKKLAKAHQKTEKLQERQAESLELLVKLQTQV